MNGCPHPKNQTRINPQPRRFTLIELLVVIAVIMIMMSMMLPALKGAREFSKKTVCAGQMKNIGMGLLSYAQDYNDLMPPSYTVDTSWKAWDVLLQDYLNDHYYLTWKSRDPKTIYRCPSTRLEGGVTDVYNSYGPTESGDGRTSAFMPIWKSDGTHAFGSSKINQWFQPASLILLYEGLINPANGKPAIATPDWFPLYSAGYYMKIDPRHGCSANFLFADFHVQNFAENNIGMDITSHMPAGGYLYWFNRGVMNY
jgi:prepilin-type processing-associated H-X9-DG protein